MLEHRAAFDNRWNEWSATSTGSNGFWFRTLDDWTQAGRVLARLAARDGYEKIGQGRQANDALIAMSAARMGATVITGNERDFVRLAEFRAFQWPVAIL